MAGARCRAGWTMTEEELVERYPRLWHMAHAGAWPAIRDRGLMSAEALVDDYGVNGKCRTNLLNERRGTLISLSADDLPGAVLRDQKPMSDVRLKACLAPGLEPMDWYRHLNGYSFFWLSKDRIWRLLKARAYRKLEQTVLTIDTRSLLATQGPNVLLSPINSGATLFSPQPRGLDLFKPVGEFPFAERKRTRTDANNVVELVVRYGVPDVAQHVLAVHSVRDQTVLGRIWCRAGYEDESP